ncbi:MAG: hypothetical protein ACREBU_10125, partial [Nitrososphaera sp.]
VVEGISREAQDQYLYMAWDTWDKGSYYQAKMLGRWMNGGFGRIDGIDNSIENRIQLQRLTKKSLSRPFVSGLPNVTRLVSIGGWLLACSENGDVRRLGVAGATKIIISSDNFNRSTENPLSDGGKWTTQELSGTGGPCLIDAALPNAIRPAGIDGNLKISIRTFEAHTGDQYAKAKIAAFANDGAGNSVGVVVRSNALQTINANLYMAHARTQTPFTRILKFIGSTQTTLASTDAVTWAVNDIIEIQIVGSTISMLKNGTTVLTATDTTLTGGSPGVSTHQTSGAAVGGGLDDYEGGNMDSSADGWEAVVYDFATHGGISFVDVASTNGGGQLAGVPGGAFESNARVLVGTLTGKVFFAKIFLDTLNANKPTLSPISVQAFSTSRIFSAIAYRNNVFVASGNKVLVRPVDQNGVWQSGDTLNINCPGAPVSMAVWNQLVMIGVQASTRGSIIQAANISQAIDTYRVDGGFSIQSMTTWGGQLVYAGKAFRSSEVYSYPGTLADRLPPGLTPTDVLALYGTHKHVMVGWNGHSGVWWIHDKGAGALCQFDTPQSNPTDNFDRADNNSLGANWTEQESASTTVQISTNQLRFLFAAGPVAAAAKRIGSFLDNQISKAKFVSATGDGGGPAIRLVFNSATNISGYVARVNSVAGTIELVRYNNEAMTGAGTVLNVVPTSVVANDIIEIEGQGARIAVRKVGGANLMEVTDSAIGAGSPGMFGRGSSGEQRWDDWEAKDFPGGVHRRTRSIVVHSGEVFYTLDDIGVIRVVNDRYKSAGVITSGWFDGGFPELQKNFADIFIRLQRPRTATETVNVFARVDGIAET